ncbi:hypothetical protein P12x_002286 [Tundrisphaera lichenicola]|uniref:hypothetical protein n=1 Tax=Tundrisphaera lichenicola TaxID=2029860 RepID=UPI003EBF9865
MNRPGPTIARYESLRASGRTLSRTAPWVRFGFLAIGGSLAMEQLGPLVSDMQLTWAERRIAGVIGLTYLGGFGLAGWIAGKLLATSAGLIEAVADQSEAAARAVDLIERQAVPILGRIALALEKLPDPGQVSPRNDDFEEARRAISGKRWALADRLVGAIVRDRPGPEAARLLADLADARQGVIDHLRSRLDASIRAGEAIRVIDLRDELTQHLRGDDLDQLDRRVARWLVGEVRRRVKLGPIRADLASLAGRVADTFADTPEGAALQNSLPNLRRSAGLCPGCGAPYRGEPDQCPRCQASPSFTPSGDPDLEVTR